MLTPKPKTTRPTLPQMRPEHPFRIRRTPTHPSCPIPIQPIPRTHPQIVWLPPLTGEISERQRGHSAKRPSQGTPKPAVIAALANVIPAEAGIQRGSVRQGCPRSRGKCPKDKGGIQRIYELLSFVAVLRRTITLRLIPYDTTSRNATLAGAQVMMSTPNLYRREIADSELSCFNAALTPALDVENGFYNVSDRPGHGYTLLTRAGDVVSLLRATPPIAGAYPRFLTSIINAIAIGKKCEPIVP